MNTGKFKNVVWKEGNYYVAQSLNVDVSSFGDSKEEALANLQEALELYIDDTPASEITSIQEPEIVTL